ncbi:CAP domain-containing protein [Streptomyces sp. NPDC052302]|uniref:CAP domain-containing protein n=1 Tax=Streptomyces sp. NPDC052302 TaxID=3365688 RepID=UPI0037CF91BD
MTFLAPRVKSVLAFISAGFLSATLLQAATAPPASAASCVWLRYADEAPKRASARADLATICLIQAERAKRGLPPIPHTVSLRGQPPQPLPLAAQRHVEAAVTQKWWGPGKDPHRNPLTGSYIDDRIRDAGFCPGRKPSTGEITYTGWGGQGTPRAAVTWWMNSPTHRDIILGKNTTWNNYGIATWPDVADKAGIGQNGAGTYVMDFGYCPR